ncbi:MAG: hypothetical protein J0L55_13580 [Caulobacterales bacterium]|nr:hypothetical protein [Caulobacterales bacterium]
MKDKSVSKKKSLKPVYAERESRASNQSNSKHNKRIRDLINQEKTSMAKNIVGKSLENPPLLGVSPKKLKRWDNGKFDKDRPISVVLLDDSEGKLLVPFYPSEQAKAQTNIEERFDNTSRQLILDIQRLKGINLSVNNSEVLAKVLKGMYSESSSAQIGDAAILLDYLLQGGISKTWNQVEDFIDFLKDFIYPKEVKTDQDALKSVIMAEFNLTEEMAKALSTELRSKALQLQNSQNSSPAMSLPEVAPELYYDRPIDKETGKRETPIRFYERVWKNYADLGVLYLDELNRLDSKLSPAIRIYCSRYGLKAKDYLPNPASDRTSKLAQGGDLKALAKVHSATSQRIRRQLNRN